MAAEDRERDQARSDNAKQKRKEQLKRWLGSETDREPERPRTKHVRVKFNEGAVFLAACSSGDQDEVEKLLQNGADINYTNVDGLTALHQVGGGRTVPTRASGAELIPERRGKGVVAAESRTPCTLGLYKEPMESINV